MNLTPDRLPEGDFGQALAAFLAIAVAALVWFSAIMPAVSWYEGRAAQSAQQRLEIAHITALQRSLPALRAAVAASASAANDHAILLPGDSDDIAGANLQSSLQALASAAGTSLDSAAAVAPGQVGVLRRIGVDVSVTATWPVLIALLTAIDTATPRMTVDDLSIAAGAAPDLHQDVPLQASFSVFAFRAGGAS
jgi:general secretion pathway protein M